MHARERLYLTADRATLVGANSPKAAFLYAALGDEIPDSAAAKFGLVDGRLKAAPAEKTAEQKAAAEKAAAAKAAREKAAADRAAAKQAAADKAAADKAAKEKAAAEDKERQAQENKGS